MPQWETLLDSVARYVIESDILLKISLLCMLNAVALIIWSTRNIDEDYLTKITKYLSRDQRHSKNQYRSLSAEIAEPTHVILQMFSLINFIL